jgi:hypothetical protein
MPQARRATAAGLFHPGAALPLPPLIVRSEIAVLRFGLSARPGELSSAAGDPRGWLGAQIRGAVPRAGDRRAVPETAAKRAFSINENLAREILELHTLGVDGGYTAGCHELRPGPQPADRSAAARVDSPVGQPGRLYFRENLDWPGLTREALLDGRDVQPTFHLRSVFKPVLADHIRIDARALTARVFPNSQGAPPLPPGLIRA